MVKGTLLIVILIFFSDYSMSNPKGRSENSIRIDKLKQTVKQRGIRKKTVPLKNNFLRNKSILHWVNKEQPKETNFSSGFEPRFLLYFDLLITSRQLFRVSTERKKVIMGCHAWSYQIGESF